MSTQQILQLPEKIKVVLIKGSSGTFIAELPEYDIFTEADSIGELLLSINDLLYEYFDIPKAMQGTFTYKPKQTEEAIPNRTNVPLSIVYQQYLLRSFYK